MYKNVIRITFLFVISKHQCLTLTDEQRRLDQMDLMKALDEVTWNKKKTHFPLTISIVDPTEIDDDDDDDDDLYSDNTANMPYYRQENFETQKTDKIFRDIFKNSKNNDAKKNGVKRVGRNEFDPNKKGGESEFDWNTFLNNQHKINMKLNRILEKRNALRDENSSDLDDRLRPVDPEKMVGEVLMPLDKIRQNNAMKIDETMIRSALKADPLIQRILKIGKKKRQDYLREMSKN